MMMMLIRRIVGRQKDTSCYAKSERMYLFVYCVWRSVQTANLTGVCLSVIQPGYDR